MLTMTAVTTAPVLAFQDSDLWQIAESVALALAFIVLFAGLGKAAFTALSGRPQGVVKTIVLTIMFSALLFNLSLLPTLVEGLGNFVEAVGNTITDTLSTNGNGNGGGAGGPVQN